MKVKSNHYTQSSCYAKYMETLGWGTFSVEKSVTGFIKTIPFFKRSIIKIPRAPLDLDYDKLDNTAKKYKALFLKIEPNEVVDEKQAVQNPDILKQQGFVRDTFPICQTRTIIVDLAFLEDEFLKSLRAETRHHLRKSWKQNFRVEIIESNESDKSEQGLDMFYALFEQCAKERGFYSPFESQMKSLWESFQNQAVIINIFDSENKKPLSGAFIIFHDDIAYYKFGASTKYGRNQYASYFLYWEMFKWARNKKMKLFDLEGIFDERYHRTQKYKGFTQFKYGWSKNEYIYIGSFTKYYSWPLKLLSKLGITT